MTYKFSNKSKQALDTAHQLLQEIFNTVIQYVDCTILEGHRGEKEQNEAYYKGNSQVKFPNSKHNKLPSLAVDAVPYPIDWNDRVRLAYFAGTVIGISKHILKDTGYVLISGIDWDNDNNVKEHQFLDFPHFELRKIN